MNVIHCYNRIQSRLLYVFNHLWSQIINLLWRPSLWGINYNHMTNRLTQLRRIIWGNRFVVTLCNVIEQIHQRHLLLFVSKRGVQLAKFINDASKWPYICVLIIAGVLYQLWTHVEWCANFGIGFKCFTTKTSSKAQISDFHGHIRRNENVGWLQISMHDSFFVHMHQGTGYFTHVSPDQGLLKRDLVLFVLFNQLFQIPFVCPLGHNYQLIVINERIDILDYICMVQGFHQINLF